MHCQCWEYCECESLISIDKWQKYDINLGLGFQVDFFNSFFLNIFNKKQQKRKLEPNKLLIFQFLPVVTFPNTMILWFSC